MHGGAKRSAGMEKVTWKRARSQEQRETRVAAILDAAGAVFQRVPYEQVTMQMIASEAGFTRSNLYRYFGTREEIFLSLYLSDFQTWVDQVQSTFTCSLDIDRFTTKWTDLLGEQQRYLSLTPLFSVSLEKKPPLEVFKKAKETLWQGTLALIPVIRSALPFLTYENCISLANTHHVVLAGAWPLGHYSEEQKQVLEEMGNDLCALEFGTFYATTIRRYLHGIKAENQASLE